MILQPEVIVTYITYEITLRTFNYLVSIKFTMAKTLGVVVDIKTLIFGGLSICEFKALT